MATRKTWWAGVIGLCLLLTGLSVTPTWAEDAFMRVTGAVQGIIPGDQTALTGIANSANQIQVFSTGFSLTNPLSTTPGQVTGRPVAGPVNLVKRFDRASPRMLRAAFTSESLTVEIVWWMSTNLGVRQTTTLRLDGAFITSIQAAADLNGGSASGFEEVSMTYQRATLTVPTITASGQVTGTTSVCLDIARNTTC
jgi:type VI secretion system Hcp family effector